LEALSGFKGLIARAVEVGEIDRNVTESDVDQLIVEALADDLNTSLAITVLHQLAREKRANVLAASLKFLGIELSTIDAYWGGNDISIALTAIANRLTLLREEAIATKNFAPVDALKATLSDAGVEVRMSKTGVELLPARGFDPSKLEALK
jgi:cysteinyl-tRNA synthetase